MIMYVALLRGINVGGKNMIKMADLKKLMEGIGLYRVETYIQSGNVIFESKEEEDILKERMEEALKAYLGNAVFVILRTREELARIIDDCPYRKEEIDAAQALNTEGESFYISFFTKNPDKEDTELLQSFQSEQDDFRVTGREIYLLLRHSIRNSKLAVQMQKINHPSTTRNLKTVRKLCEILKNR